MTAMMKSVCPTDDIYRLGGDEFVAFLEDISKEDFGETFARLKEKAKALSIHAPPAANGCRTPPPCCGA